MKESLSAALPARDLIKLRFNYDHVGVAPGELR